MGIKHTLLIGCGYTLSRVANEQCVCVVQRDSSYRTLTDRGLLAIKADYNNPLMLSTIFKQFPDIQIIVDSVPPPSTGATLEQIIKNHALHVQKQGAHLIYLSTSGVFGADNGQTVTESTPCNPRHTRALARKTVEDTYRLLLKNFSALRIPAIYGPGRGIGHALKNGSYSLINQGENYTNRIHVEDLAAVIRKLLVKDELPPVLCISDDEPTQANKVVEYYCTTFNLPAPKNISIAEAEKQGLHSLLSNQKIQNDLMKNILGAPLKYPSYREGAFSEMSF